VTRRDIDHYTGCMLGGAAGDALGAPVEFKSLEDIRSIYGPEGVTGMEDIAGRGGCSGTVGKRVLPREIACPIPCRLHGRDSADQRHGYREKDRENKKCSTAALWPECVNTTTP
jgi:ADP-ribosylglycohydrolase